MACHRHPRKPALATRSVESKVLVGRVAVFSYTTLLDYGFVTKSRLLRRLLFSVGQEEDEDEEGNGSQANDGGSAYVTHSHEGGLLHDLAFQYGGRKMMSAVR